MKSLSPVEEVHIDPRVRRTRQMLERALDGLLVKKDFENISVGEIAEAATLNRATFYAHFTDKFALLEAMVASRFHDLLVSRGVSFDGACSSALYGVVLAVCDFLADIPYCSEQRGLSQHLELAMVGIVRQILKDGVTKHPRKAGIDPSLVAAALTGGIYAAAKEWMRTADRSEAIVVARSITSLVALMLPEMK